MGASSAGYISIQHMYILYIYMCVCVCVYNIHLSTQNIYMYVYIYIYIYIYFFFFFKQGLHICNPSTQKTEEEGAAGVEGTLGWNGEFKASLG
jgi:hypothetical protein